MQLDFTNQQYDSTEYEEFMKNNKKKIMQNVIYSLKEKSSDTIKFGLKLEYIQYKLVDAIFHNEVVHCLIAQRLLRHFHQATNDCYILYTSKIRSFEMIQKYDTLESLNTKV